MLRQQRKQKAVALILTLVLTLMLVTALAVPASAADACDRMSGCSGPADCAWWGLRCALTNPFDFMNYMNEEYW